MSPPHDTQRLPPHIGPRQVLDLAWPVIVSLLSYTLMAAADVVFVGQLGTAPLAGVGAGITLLFLSRGYAFGMLQGVRVVTAQRTGAEDHDAVPRLAWQAVWLGLGIGLLLTLAIPLAWPALGWMGTEGEVRAFGWQYLVIRLIAAPTDLAFFGLSAWFQGRGDTRTPMKANVTANLSNIGLDVLLVFGFGPVPALGVAGAAIATNVAGLIGLAILGRAFVRSPAFRAPRAPSRALLRRVWDLGHAMGVQDVMDIGAFTLFMAILTAAGEAHMAAHVVVVRIISVSFLPGYGIASAAGVLVGQSLGAGRPDLAGQALRSALGLALAMMAVFGVVFLAAPEPLLAVFGAEPEVEDLGRRLLVIAATFQLFDAVATVLYQSLAGAGDTRFAMRVTVAASWVVKLPIAYGLAIPGGMGVVGAWVGFDAELLVLAVVFAWRVRSGRWLRASAPSPAGVPAAR